MGNTRAFEKHNPICFSFCLPFPPVPERSLPFRRFARPFPAGARAFFHPSPLDFFSPARYNTLNGNDGEGGCRLRPREYGRRDRPAAVEAVDEEQRAVAPKPEERKRRDPPLSVESSRDGCVKV